MFSPAFPIFLATVCWGQELLSNTSRTSKLDLGLLENDEYGPWSSLLEEWTLTNDGDHRQMRIMKLPPTHGYYVTNRVDSPYYDEWPALTPPPAPGKIVNKPPPKPYQAGQQYNRAPPPNRKEVSETDLYLLGAIEKLVFRLDFMEKRLKKTEELVHYLMVGADKRSDPCPENFSRAGGTCYHFAGVKQFDWKSASNICKSLDSHLVEMETIQENQEIISYIIADEDLRGKDYWTGGLNPGLLWIWSSSARPVPNGSMNESQQLLTGPVDTPTSIKGSGRCLKLSYNPAIRNYAYFGADCSSKHNFICEKVDKNLSNEIKRISKEIGNSTVTTSTKK